jgi:hypothetical protein
VKLISISTSSQPLIRWKAPAMPARARKGGRAGQQQTSAGTRQGTKRDEMAVNLPRRSIVGPPGPAPSQICRPHVGDCPAQSPPAASISPSRSGHVIIANALFLSSTSISAYVLYFLTAVILFAPFQEGIYTPGSTGCLWLESHTIETNSVSQRSQSYSRILALHNVVYRSIRMGRIWPLTGSQYHDEVLG